MSSTVARRSLPASCVVASRRSRSLRLARRVKAFMFLHTIIFFARSEWPSCHARQPTLTRVDFSRARDSRSLLRDDEQLPGGVADQRRGITKNVSSTFLLNLLGPDRVRRNGLKPRDQLDLRASVQKEW